MEICEFRQYAIALQLRNDQKNWYLMLITVNDESRQLEPGTTVASLLAMLELRPEQVAVERNREIVPRRTYAETALEPNDHLEVVTLVGGG